MRFYSKSSKYNAKKVTLSGITFDSRREADRWLVLTERQKRGEITDLRRQVHFELAPAVILDGRKKPALRYVADFTYTENGAMVIEDVKSAYTRKMPTYRIKRHLMKSVLGLDIKEV